MAATEVKATVQWAGGSVDAVREAAPGQQGGWVTRGGEEGDHSLTCSQMSHLLLWGLQGPRGHPSFLSLVGRRKEGKQGD